MNKEQKKFKQVIKKRRRSQTRKQAEERQRLFNLKSPAERAKLKYEYRHKKDDKKKAKEKIRKELNIK